MLEKDDIKEVNEAILSHGMQWPQEAWGRIKRFIEEAQKTPNNSAIMPCNLWRENGTCNVVAYGSPCGDKPCQVTAQHQ